MNFGFNQPQTVILIILNEILGVNALTIPYGGMITSLLLSVQSILTFTITSILTLKGRELK